MLRVALTGGIGCGKTTVANLFAQRGIPVIDTDVLARELTLPQQPAYHKIIQHFGEHIISADQSLDRKKLAQIVFSDPTQRQWLENLLHPLIREQVEQQIQRLTSPYCIVVIPLLFETNQQHDYNRVLLVDCPPHQQIQRIHARDARSEEEIRQIINAQVTADTRRKGSDEVISNTGALEELDTQVLSLHTRYLELGNKPQM